MKTENKSVLISIRPEWCELIANGEKTVEVRKTKPKLKTPFKSYIYCTKPDKAHQTVCGCMVLNSDELYRHPKQGIKYGDSIELMLCDDYTKDNFLDGKIIGEFVCDEIEELKRNTVFNAPALYSQSCLTRDEYFGYIGNKTAYIWHISDLKIYDKPKELSEFCCTDNNAIKNCKHRLRMGQPEYITKHGGWIKGSYGCLKNGETEWCENCISKPLKRAPQSWCYVEELENGRT